MNRSITRQADGSLLLVEDARSYTVPSGTDESAAISAFFSPDTPEVPSSVTNYQARTALIASGQFTSVDQAIHASGNLVAIQAWEYANVFTRTDQFVVSFASILGLNDAQVDHLFIAASQVV